MTYVKVSDRYLIFLLNRSLIERDDYWEEQTVISDINESIKIPWIFARQPAGCFLLLTSACYNS